MGIMSSIGSALSSAVSAVTSFASTALSTIVSVGGSLLSGVADIGVGLLKGLGFLKDDDPVEPETWGDKFIQASEQNITPDDYNSFGDYMDALRGFELDPERSKEITAEQKSAACIKLSTRAIEHHVGAPDGSAEQIFVLAGANPEYFTSERFQSLLSSGMSVTDICDYFEGNLMPSDADVIESGLIDLEQGTSPDKDSSTSRQGLQMAAQVTQEKLVNILKQGEN